MKYNCDMIRDLLPLYQDGVCSESSRLAAEEHLAECEACRDHLEALRSGEDIEIAIDTEREQALTSQKKFFRRRSAVVGTVFAGVFMLPVLICLIVGLASGGISWVLVVLAAMLIPVSLVAVPLLAPENKGLWTLGSFTVSLMLLLGVCCVTSGGSWFFTAASACLFGLSVVFSPFAVGAKPVAELVKDRKGLTVMALDTALYVIMMLCIGLSHGLGADYYRIAASVSLPVFIWIWGLFAVIRYAKLGGLFKTAACLGITATVMIVSGIIFGSGTGSLMYIETMGKRFVFSPFTALAVLLMITGAVLALIKLIFSKTRRKK